MEIIVKYIAFLYFCTTVCCRIHNLEIKNDARKYIALSTFGYYTRGTLEVQLKNFQAIPENDMAVFGFSLHKAINIGMDSYIDENNHCILEDELKNSNNSEEILIYLKLDLKNNKLRVACSDLVHIYKHINDIDIFSSTPCNDLNFDIISALIDGHIYYNTSFIMAIQSIKQEGLYKLFFRNCPNYNPNTKTLVDFTIKIIEKNDSGYLSVGEIVLPTLYCIMFIFFMTFGMFWVSILHYLRPPISKMHYMMVALVFLKTISLACHGANYHYIKRTGTPFATWSILFYITHIGVLMLFVLMLVNIGWSYIKSTLEPRDKTMFMAVIPLQVVANVANIILEDTREYLAWKYLVMLVDLLCCSCILFPILWSIRRLQVSNDDKAATKLRNLKAFCKFYVMIICYIYATRIVTYLVKMMETFQYGWLHEMFQEIATYFFFLFMADFIHKYTSST